MANSLFEFQPAESSSESFPEGITDVELSDLQKAVLKLLAFMDHPHVYTVSLPRLPLEIRIQEAQMQIDKKGEGASIKLNPSSPDDRVVMETPTRYIYTKWSPRALRVYHILSEQGVNSILSETGKKRKKLRRTLQTVSHGCKR